MSRCAGGCWTNPRRLRRRAGTCRSCPTALRKCLRKIEMRFVRPTRLGFVFACCSLATAVFSRSAPTADEDRPSTVVVCIHFNSARRSGANGIETYFYSSQSLQLASAIHYYVSRAAPSSNRGVRRRGYYVLRRTAAPAVLVECGFLTNPTEAQYAQSVNYRQMLAEQIARGIRSRSLVTSRTGSIVASADVVPLQPYIDQ